MKWHFLWVNLILKPRQNTGKKLLLIIIFSSKLALKYILIFGASSIKIAAVVHDHWNLSKNNARKNIFLSNAIQLVKITECNSFYSFSLVLNLSQFQFPLFLFWHPFIVWMPSCFFSPQNFTLHGAGFAMKLKGKTSLSFLIFLLLQRNRQHHESIS